MPSTLTVVLSPEDLARSLMESVADIIVETSLANEGVHAKPATVFALTDATLEVTNSKTEALKIHKAIATKMVREIFREKIESKVRQWTKEFQSWWKNKFQSAVNKAEELAEKIIRKAKELGVSVARVIAQIYQRLIGFVLRSAVTPSISIGKQSERTTLKPSKLSVSVDLSPSPFVDALDVNAVMGILKSILTMTISVKVEYSAVSPK